MTPSYLRRLAAALCIVGAVVGSITGTWFEHRAVAARNSAGTESLPAGNPVSTGTTITSTWANTTLNDISTELTNSLDRQGRGAMQAPLQLASGTSALPGLTFSAETNSGLYRVGSNDFKFQVAGTTVQEIQPAGITVSSTGNGTTAIISTGAAGNAGNTSGGRGLNATGAAGVGSGTNGAGVIGTGGANALVSGGSGVGGFGGSPTSGNLVGGVGLVGVGGVASGSANGGNGASSTGGTAPGSGTGGNGANLTGGISALGTGGNGLLATGGAPGGSGIVANGNGGGVAVLAGTGGLQIGSSGNTITASYSGSTTFTGAAIAAQTSLVFAATITGVSAGAVCDAYMVNQGSFPNITLSTLSSANTVNVYAHNISTGPLTPSGTINIRCFQ